MPPPSPGSSTLLLFPTDLERRRFDDRGGLPVGLALQEVCGFGPVAAAARTAQLLALHRPRTVVLCGIAGTYSEERVAIGEAAVFGEVALDGVGAGAGEEFVPPPALGFPQWPGSPDTRDEPIELLLPLSADGPQLLTTCAAAASPEEVRQRRARFPEAVAEDMEGFAVAMACTLARVPLVVVRGISNLVGDRDSEHWRIVPALATARERTLAVLEELT